MAADVAEVELHDYRAPVPTVTTADLLAKLERIRAKVTGRDEQPMLGLDQSA